MCMLNEKKTFILFFVWDEYVYISAFSTFSQDIDGTDS